MHVLHKFVIRWQEENYVSFVTITTDITSCSVVTMPIWQFCISDWYWNLLKMSKITSFTFNLIRINSCPTAISIAIKVSYHMTPISIRYALINYDFLGYQYSPCHSNNTSIEYNDIFYFILYSSNIFIRMTSEQKRLDKIRFDWN